MRRILKGCSYALLLMGLMACGDSSDHPELTAVGSFGPNPGDLKMYLFEPSSPTADMPLVVALHGCTQNAADMADLTEWNRLGERYGFYVVYPEQSSRNNISRCFNWFQEGDINRNQGESRSIRSMVDHMLVNYPINPQRVYVTGLSAGAAMTSVILACYPERFSAGAIHAGGAYKAATDVWQSMSALAGNVSKGAQEWGDLVRAQNPTYTGPYPRVSVFHGTSDPTVNANNATETVKQWTNVHGTDAVADFATDGFEGAADVQQAVYMDGTGQQVVVRYTITDMGHAIAVNPGSCRHQGGSSSTFATDKGFFSTYWTARFFGLIPEPVVSGPSVVSAGQQQVTFSVPAYPGSSYAWQFPDGCVLTQGGNGPVVMVDWGQQSGEVTVTETDVDGCVYTLTPLAVSF